MAEATLLSTLYRAIWEKNPKTSGYTYIYNRFTFCTPESNTTFKSTAAAVESLSHIQCFATSWTVTCQAPRSMGFPRQE